MAVSLYKVILRKQGKARRAKAKVNLAKATDRKVTLRKISKANKKQG